jgi:hypothetical protein
VSNICKMRDFGGGGHKVGVELQCKAALHSANINQKLIRLDTFQTLSKQCYIARSGVSNEISGMTNLVPITLKIKFTRF